jgi:hypothetical protein
MEQKVSGFRSIITGNELWFSLYYPRDSAWAASRDELPSPSSRKSARKVIGLDLLIGETNPQSA